MLRDASASALGSISIKPKRDVTYDMDEDASVPSLDAVSVTDPSAPRHPHLATVIPAYFSTLLIILTFSGVIEFSWFPAQYINY